MIVEIGKKVQEVFESRNMKLTDFADALGTVRQNVYRIFKKSHLDTSLLLKISRVLNHNFFKYYIEPSETGSNADLTQVKMEIEEKTRQLELARKEIDYLKTIIRLMEEKSIAAHKFENDAVSY